MSEYRIVTDAWLGYEVQIRRWWWPFWMEADFCNTHNSLGAAERWAERHAQGAQGCVKYLGRFERSTVSRPNQPAPEK